MIVREKLKNEIIGLIKTNGLNQASKYFGGLTQTIKLIGYNPKELTVINDQPYFLTINGAPNILYYCDKFTQVTNTFDFGSWTSLTDKIYVGGFYHKTGIVNLSSMIKTKGNFGLYDIILNNFGGLKKHNGNLTIADNSVILQWDTLTNIKGNLVIYDTAEVFSMGNLNHVGGKMDIRGFVENLGNLEYVGNDLILTNNTLHSLGNLKHIGGRLRIRKSNLQDIGNLKHVGGSALIDNNTHPNVVKQLKEIGVKIIKG